jgi:hypothetical protein
VILACPRVAGAAADATVLRLFLTDGTALASVGEYTRVDDRVIFSMPAGGAPDQPRLYVISLPAKSVDWPRTEKYAASARYQRYADTRGEDDFQLLSSEIARVLNEIALSTDRRKALEMAESARKTLAEWPVDHFGYRQADVREIVTLLDESISDLRASLGIGQFELALVASPPDVLLEPVTGLPTAREQLDQVLRVAWMVERSSERVALLQVARGMLDEPGNAIALDDAARLRSTIDAQLRDEANTDAKYAALAKRLITSANKAAADARIADVEKVVARIPQEDAALGARRPETVYALRASLLATLDAARELRLLRDRWVIRRSLYQEWQRSAGVQLLQLVKLQPTLEAIRRVDGPSPSLLDDTRQRLTGGAERLQRIGVNSPADLRPVNDLLVSAWRFAENAVNARYAAISAGDIAAAWNASSAAAAAELLIQRAQKEIRTLLEPPKLRK